MNKIKPFNGKTNFIEAVMIMRLVEIMAAQTELDERIMNAQAREKKREKKAYEEVRAANDGHTLTSSERKAYYRTHGYEDLVDALYDKELNLGV